MEYKVGDLVVLIDKGGYGWVEGMQKWRGAIVELTKADKYDVRFQGSGGYNFHFTDIAGYAKSKIIHDILKEL